jgi:hypothetical protein
MADYHFEHVVTSGLFCSVPITRQNQILQAGFTFLIEFSNFKSLLQSHTVLSGIANFLFRNCVPKNLTPLKYERF